MWPPIKSFKWKENSLEIMGRGQVIVRGIKLLYDEGPKSFITKAYKFTCQKLHILQYILSKPILNFKYGAAAPSVTELIYINPNEVKKMVTGNKPFSANRTAVVDGDWDKQRIEFDFSSERQVRERINWAGIADLEQYAFFESARKHFEENIPWEETEFYKYKFKNREGGHYGTKKKIYERFKEFDSLYQSVRTNGYKSQKELQKFDPKTVPLSKRSNPQPNREEVAVAIGRDGNIFHVDGRHRLAVARSLNIKTIPARVVARHVIWQQFRSQVAASKDPKLLFNRMGVTSDHPDLCRLV